MTEPSQSPAAASPDVQKQQALDAVVARAGRDAEFRAALLVDPYAALDVPSSGVPAGARFPVRFVEHASDEAADGDVRRSVVLPPLVRAEELSDQELHAVAGGDGTGLLLLALLLL